MASRPPAEAPIATTGKRLPFFGAPRRAAGAGVRRVLAVFWLRTAGLAFGFFALDRLRFFSGSGFLAFEVFFAATTNILLTMPRTAH